MLVYILPYVSGWNGKLRRYLDNKKFWSHRLIDWSNWLIETVKQWRQSHRKCCRGAAVWRRSRRAAAAARCSGDGGLRRQSAETAAAGGSVLLAEEWRSRGGSEASRLRQAVTGCPICKVVIIYPSYTKLLTEPGSKTHCRAYGKYKLCLTLKVKSYRLKPQCSILNVDLSMSMIKKRKFYSNPSK